MSHLHIRIVRAAAALAALTSTVAAQTPDYVAIKAGRVITVSGEDLTPGVIVIEDGEVTAVGTGLEFPATAEVIDAPRATVMPGMILARTRYGLVDFSRSGVQGDQTAAAEVYLDTIPFDDLIEAGFTTACFVPSGRGITGMASAYLTAGAPDTRLLDATAYLDVEDTNKKTLRDALKKAQAEIDKVEKARKEWDEKQKKKKAEAEARKKEAEQPDEETPEEQPEDQPTPPTPDKAPRDPEQDEPNKDNGDPPAADAEKKTDDDTFKPPPIDPKYQPLVDLIQKKPGAVMMLRVTRAAGVLHLDDVLQHYDELAHVLNITARTSSDLHHVVATLGERTARIVMRPMIHLLPDTRIRYNLIKELATAGCEISIIPRSDRRAALTDVRQQLAEVIRAGLDKNDAYKMLTLHPARVLGLEDRMGSIQKDRRADLVFFNGDPLDPHTEVQRVLIMGKTVYNADDQQ